MNEARGAGRSAVGDGADGFVLVVCEDEPHSRNYLLALAASGIGSERVRLVTPTGRTDHAALEAELAALAASAQGVLLCGGPDVDPTRYGEEALADANLEVLPELDALDYGALTGARAAGRPVLAICRGLQVANAWAGGTLWQDLPSQTPSTVIHSIREPKDALAHEVEVAASAHPLADLLATGAEIERFVQVNSRHHQAIKDLAPDLVALGFSPDGMIEAAAVADPAWWLWGVQWHPENLLAFPVHRELFARFREVALGPG